MLLPVLQLNPFRAGNEHTDKRIFVIKNEKRQKQRRPVFVAAPSIGGHWERPKFKSKRFQPFLVALVLLKLFPAVALAAWPSPIFASCQQYTRAFVVYLAEAASSGQSADRRSSPVKYTTNKLTKKRQTNAHANETEVSSVCHISAGHRK